MQAIRSGVMRCAAATAVSVVVSLAFIPAAHAVLPTPWVPQFEVQAPDAAGNLVEVVPEPTSAPDPAPSLAPTGSEVLWRGDMEEGSLADWFAPSTSASGSYGGGEYNSGSGDTVNTSSPAHSGTQSAKATVNGSGGTRLFRWKELRENRELYLESWFYFPANATLIADPGSGRYWNIFQLKSRSTSGANDPFWYVDLKNNGGGSLRPTLLWWPGVEGPHQGESGRFRRYQPPAGTTIPTGRWFKLKWRVRQSKDFDGLLQVWLDDKLIFDQQGVRTSYANCTYNSWCTTNEWSVNNYTDGLDKLPYSIYIDDAQISR
jgi:hypothetical protein